MAAGENAGRYEPDHGQGCPPKLDIPRMPSLLSVLPLLFLGLLAALPARSAEPLRFHYPDSGAPPWLYLAPGAGQPSGVVADLLARVARESGRELRFEFQPREAAGPAVRSGSVDGAMFFSVTRPAPKGVAVSAPLQRMQSVLVTPRATPLGYAKPAQLAFRRLCTLTDEVYPPLALLEMGGKLAQRKAKTEQAQLLMLRNDDCVAAVLNGPMYRWLAARYHWDDLRAEKVPLLEEELVLGFAAGEAAFAEKVNATVEKMQKSGELGRLVQKHLPAM